MRKPRCDTCKYWELHEKYPYYDDYTGHCYRYPPQLDTVWAGKLDDEEGEGCEQHDSCWQHPITIASRWCGEHVPVQEDH